ncbi:MAG: hypothetical protein JSW72_10310 [Candidatus Bathyarchaeota archaeon]|nr:MAG: hypothetical protein JSW72_10310 [Candidatus Bathyarchaeota archaeon]
MKAKIAVATVSGKAYYLLVKELKKKKAQFLSLTPSDVIPIDVKVVITTKKEASAITHENVLTYEENGDLVKTVDEALRVIKGKKRYERLVVGVDPGRNLGVAVLGDGKILETKSYTNVDETVNTITEILNRTPATHKTVRIGNGAPSHSEKLCRHLIQVLPEHVVIERVPEAGTSRSYGGQQSHRRGKIDINSAIKIGQRQGKLLLRRKRDA